MNAPEFVQIHYDVTINPRFVARLERVRDPKGGSGQTRVIMHDGTSYLVDQHYELSLQRICGIFG